METHIEFGEYPATAHWTDSRGGRWRVELTFRWQAPSLTCVAVCLHSKAADEPPRLDTVMLRELPIRKLVRDGAATVIKELRSASGHRPGRRGFKADELLLGLANRMESAVPSSSGPRETGRAFYREIADVAIAARNAQESPTAAIKAYVEKKTKKPVPIGTAASWLHRAKWNFPERFAMKKETKK